MLATALGGSKALWFATRGAGTVTFILLTATVVLGIAGVARLQASRLPRFIVAGLHRNVTLLALAVLGAHIATGVADTYAPIGIKDAVIPFTSRYRPIWLGLGAIAFDLLLALTLTSFLRSRIGLRRWKQIHWLAYLCWPVALVHSLGTGSDARIGWMQVVAAGCTLAVAAAVVVRLGAPRSWSAGRAFAGGLAVVLPLAGALWYQTGPGQRGWASRAGTPTRLLAAKTGSAAARLTRASVPTLPRAPFTASFVGRLRQSQSGGHELIDIIGHTSGGAAGKLWIRLQGLPQNDGVAMTASGASFGPAGWPEEFVGSIAALQGTRLQLALASRTARMTVAVDLTIDSATGAVRGALSAVPGTQ
jgi:hypothetical protein